MSFEKDFEDALGHGANFEAGEGVLTMKRLARAVGVAALLATAAPADAAIINDLGVNPTSADGDFSNAVFGANFTDQYLFQLVGAPAFITIASVTNVYPRTTDFITDFTASIFSFGLDDLFKTADDQEVIGPVDATACAILNCQFMAGSGILAAGNYYAEFAGQGGGTSGYGGNLSVAAIPLPAGIWLFGTAIAGLGALSARRRRRLAA